MGICIIAGAFFGVKYALSNFLGGSDDKEKTTDKSGTGSKDKEQNEGNKQTNTNPGDDEDEEKKNESRPIRQKRLSCRNSWISMNLS